MWELNESVKNITVNSHHEILYGHACNTIHSHINPPLTHETRYCLMCMFLHMWIMFCMLYSTPSPQQKNNSTTVGGVSSDFRYENSLHTSFLWCSRLDCRPFHIRRHVEINLGSFLISRCFVLSVQPFHVLWSSKLDHVPFHMFSYTKRDFLPYLITKCSRFCSIPFSYV